MTEAGWLWNRRWFVLVEIGIATVFVIDIA